MRICYEIHEPDYAGKKRIEKPASGKLRPYCTSVKIGGGGPRVDGPVLYANNLADARKCAKLFKIQPLAISGELGFETDTDGNVLIAAFRANDHVTTEEIGEFIEAHRVKAKAQLIEKANALLFPAATA